MTEPIRTSSRSTGLDPSAPLSPGEPQVPGAVRNPPNAAAEGEPISAAARHLVDRFTSSTVSPAPTESEPHVRGWSRDKLLSEGACLFPCRLALRAAEQVMPAHGLARSMMDHFLSGSAAPVRIDLNAELARNPQLREYLSSRVEFEIAQRAQNGESVPDMNGAIWVPQNAYGSTDEGFDQQLALGGTYFEYQVAGSAEDGGLQVTLNVADHYFWSPSEPRPTQCLHVCGDELVASHAATEFYQYGEGTIVVGDPAQQAPATPLEVGDQPEHIR